MALIAGSNAINTTFTAAAGAFRVQVTGVGQVQLMSRATSGDAWAPCDMFGAGVYEVTNTLAATEYRFTPAPGSSTNPTFRADQ